MGLTAICKPNTAASRVTKNVYFMKQLTIIEQRFQKRSYVFRL
jgi:hypothetical protein